jgi:hypothetical protein
VVAGGDQPRDPAGVGRVPRQATVAGGRFHDRDRGVFAAYRRIRRMRHEAIGARFAWIARVYERAHGAFIHGAILGRAHGGRAGRRFLVWRRPDRPPARQHPRVGWADAAGHARVLRPDHGPHRIETGGDERSARALRWGATGLAVAVVLLLLTGIGGLGATIARVGAGLGLALYAGAATMVCLPVGRAVWRAKSPAARPLVAAVCVWLPLVAWADVAVVSTGGWRWLDAVGVAALTGVLAQAILATLIYLAPMLRGSTTAARKAIRLRLEIGTYVRAAAMGVGVAACIIGVMRIGTTAPMATIEWSLIGATLLVTAITAMWPSRPANARL